MKKLLGLLGCASLLVACANEVIIESDDTAAGGAGGGSSSSSSGAGTSGTTGGGTAVCTPKDDGSGGFQQPTCKDLDRLVLVEPSVAGDTDADGLVEPGESATVTVLLKDTSGLGFNWYPGVQFDSLDAAVGAEADSWFYAILPCTEMATTATIKVAPDVAPGTKVTIRARVAMLNEECPETFAIDIPVLVQ